MGNMRCEQNRGHATTFAKKENDSHTTNKFHVRNIDKRCYKSNCYEQIQMATFSEKSSCWVSVHV